MLLLWNSFIIHWMRLFQIKSSSILVLFSHRKCIDQYVPARYLDHSNSKKTKQLHSELEAKIIDKYSKRAYCLLLSHPHTIPSLSRHRLATVSSHLIHLSHPSVDGYTPLLAKLNYLDFVQEIPLYGVAYFKVKVGDLLLCYFKIGLV